MNQCKTMYFLEYWQCGNLLLQNFLCSKNFPRLERLIFRDSMLRLQRNSVVEEAWKNSNLAEILKINRASLMNTFHQKLITLIVFCCNQHYLPRKLLALALPPFTIFSNSKSFHLSFKKYKVQHLSYKNIIWFISFTIVIDLTKDKCTPSPRCFPLHSKHTIVRDDFYCKLKKTVIGTQTDPNSIRHTGPVNKID